VKDIFGPGLCRAYKSIVVFLMVLCLVGGIGAYERLGRQEDPDFSVQTMVDVVRRTPQMWNAASEQVAAWPEARLTLLSFKF
jgi:hypothetical protein